MDPVHDRGSMDPVQRGGPWTPGPCFVLFQLHEQAVNKAWVGSDCGLDRTLDRITSDRIGLLFSLLVQKNYFEKSCFYATCSSTNFHFTKKSNAINYLF